MAISYGIFGIEPSASFINFIQNDHERKILFIILPVKAGLYRLQINIISIRKRIVDTDVVNYVTYSYQCVIPRVVIRFYYTT